MQIAWIFPLLLFYPSWSCAISCTQTDDCVCYPGTTLEVQCPAHFSSEDARIVMHTEEKETTEIDCYETKKFPMSLLPNITLGETARLEIKFCPLPPGNFKHVLEHFSMTELKVLQFESCTDNVTLTRNYFEGLSDLERLKLIALNFTLFEQDALGNTPNLYSLEMERNRNLTLTSDVFRNLSGLNALYLAQNEFEDLPEGLFTQLRSLRILHLWNNNLKVIRARSFSGLSNLTSLDLNSNKIGNISEEAFRDLTELSQINLSGNKLKHLSNIFRNNKKLVRILMVFNPGVHLSDYLFANLALLKEVDLARCYLESVPEHIFENSSNLRVVKLGSNKLKDIPPGLFKGLRDLRELSLENNSISAVDNDVFKDLTSLEKINLQKNKITVIHHWAFSNNENLRNIDVSYNEYSGGTGFPFMNTMENLEDLDLSHNLIEHVKDVFSAINVLKLERLDMSYNRLKEIKLTDLQPLGALRVNLDHNNITGVNFDRVKEGEGQVIISLDHNPIECNCNTYQLLQFSKMFKILTEDLVCANPPSLKDLKVETLSPLQLTCPLEKPCPDDCACVWRPSDKSVVIDCSNKNLTEFPRFNHILNNSLGFNHTEIHLEGNNLTFVPRLSGYDNITKLYLSYNRIRKIDWLPPKLEVVHLDNNELSHLGHEVLNTLNTSRLAKLTLENNRWSCDCAAATLRNFLRTHSRLIKADNVKCSNNIDGLLINLGDNVLCPEWFILHLVVPLLAIFVVLTAILVVFYRYQKQIKIWLFAHDLCLCCFPEEKLDSEKIYDVFVSYSDKDEDFVVQNLLPVLEGGPNPYKLCLHYRNGTAGELITTQSMNSVEQSRRTLIVLSTNFLESVWNQLELRTAHAQAMTQEKLQVIIVLYGDVDVDQLDDEFKLYLKSNTYVKWGDRYFWDKLKFALPHYKRTRNNQKIANVLSCIDDKFSLVAPVTASPGSTPPVLALDASTLKKNPLNFVYSSEKAPRTVKRGLY